MAESTYENKNQDMVEWKTIIIIEEKVAPCDTALLKILVNRNPIRATYLPMFSATLYSQGYYLSEVCTDSIS